MTFAKLFILGQEIELIWIDMNYHRRVRINGKPTTEIMGGLTTLCFASQIGGDLILRWMTKESEDNTWEEVDKMEKGKICFYENGYDYPPTKTWKFNDALLIYYREIFNAEGEEPMQTIITISPAIQNYGADFIKRWNVSWIPPSERVPYQPMENNPGIVEIDWVNEQEETISETQYLNKVAVKVKLQNNKGGEVKIKITKKEGSEFEKGKNELTFSKQAKNGDNVFSTFKVNDVWEDFKNADIDELVAKVEYCGMQKQSKALQIAPTPKAIVDFRPSKNYDGEYGFDYMRKKDKKDNLTYKDILGTNKSVKGVNTFTKYPTSAKYNNLKDSEYKTITFPWHKDSAGKEIEYIQSWLTIYPKETQTLSLQIETIENAKKQDLTFEYDKTLFKLNTETILAQSKGKKRLKDHLTITCLKEFSTDQVIKVMYQKRQLGQLDILKNDKANRKKAQVVFVKVKTELYEGTKLNGNTTSKSGKPEKDLLEKYLKQALIKLDLKEIEFDLTANNAKTKKPKYPNFNKDFTLLDVVSNPTSPPKILNKYHNTTKTKLVAFMETEFNAQFPSYKDYYKVFFFADRGGRTDKVKKIVGLGGYAKQIKSKSVAVFWGRGKTDATHELLHAMSLYHSFSNSASFGYKKKATKNIMDYSSKKNNTWLWQWKKLWKNKDIKNE